MKINKIFVTGGSQCIGGGFNWKKVIDVYKNNLNIDIQNRFDITYPGIVGKYFNCDVIYEGEFGGSVNRLIKKTYDYIFNNDVKDTLFIIEIPPGWRDEFYSVELKRNVNMTIGNILSADDETDMACGNNIEDLHKIHKDITNYFYNFVEYDIDRKKWMYSVMGLLSYFKLNKINYILIDSGDFEWFLKNNNLTQDEYNFLWFHNNSGIKNNNAMNNWINEKGLTIKVETNGLSNDEHMGIKGHQLVAEEIIKYINEKN
jgi:hypothetical protein